VIHHPISLEDMTAIRQVEKKAVDWLKTAIGEVYRYAWLI
jgi:hypothetical protein